MAEICRRLLLIIWKGNDEDFHIFLKKNNVQNRIFNLKWKWGMNINFVDINMKTF